MEIDSEAIRAFLLELLPTAVTLLIVTIGIAIANRLLLGNVKAHESDSAVGRQLVMLALTIVGLVAFILSLPLNATRQGQLLSLLGLLLSGAIALSSTNLLGNIMAGFMLRAVQAFRSGDFIEVGDEFGRVSERGLFHVELQTPRREFTTLPNSYLANNPFRVTTESSVVDAKVSLGYDVPRREIEQLLLAAAEKAGLEEPFVRVLELGDYSVTYQVAGILREVERMLAARSRINTQILDALHGAGIEIISPKFISERAYSPSQVFIPRAPVGSNESSEPDHDEAPAEVFDKASSAALREKLEELKSRLEQDIKDLDARVRAGEEVEGEESLAEQATRAERHLARVTVALEDQEPES